MPDVFGRSGLVAGSAHRKRLRGTSILEGHDGVAGFDTVVAERA
jgi:hypothetical protein